MRFDGPAPISRQTALGLSRSRCVNEPGGISAILPAGVSQRTLGSSLEHFLDYAQDPANGIWLGTVEQVATYIRARRGAELGPGFRSSRRSSSCVAQDLPGSASSRSQHDSGERRATLIVDWARSIWLRAAL